MMRVTLGMMFGILLAPLSAGAEPAPTSLACQANAKAWRTYGFFEKSWRDPGSGPFATATTNHPVDGFPLRGKVFSALNTRKPMVRSITPRQTDSPEEAVE